MRPLFDRAAVRVFLGAGPGSAEPPRAEEIAALPAPRASEGPAAEDMLGDATHMAARPDEVLLPVPEALARSAPLRVAFAEALRLPALARYRAMRPLLWLGLVPLAMLAELDRELAAAGAAGAAGRLACDLFVLAAMAVDLARPLPRHPRASAAVLFGAGARFALFLARACGHGVHAAITVAAGTALAGAGVFLWPARAPGPGAITRDVLRALGRGAPDADRSPRASPSPASAGRAGEAPPGLTTIAAAIAAAAGLPLILALAQRQGIGLWPRAAIYAGYATLVPAALERALSAGASRDRRVIVPLVPLVPVVAAFALTLGLTRGVHHAVDALVHAARCIDPRAAAEGQRILDAETWEVTRNLDQARDEWAFFLMNVAVVPLVEERVYRAFLQRILVARWGRARGIGAAAIVFGLSHLGVYRVASYQTVLLGVAFGVAFEEGGLVAAAIAHALWNLHLLL